MKYVVCALLMIGLGAQTAFAQKSFPEAIGFGAETIGGRGGKVLKVTNLNDTGDGSLRWALTQRGPRYVVFEVGGVVTLNSPIEIDQPYLTVAGQTAPGDGIVVRGSRIRVVASQVIIRGMRFRPGDGPGDKLENRDGISIGKNEILIENVMIDSNSFSWSVDELTTVWGNVRNVTFSNNLIAEALANAGHPKGEHSKAVLFGQKAGLRGPHQVTFVRNLVTNSLYRCPLAKNSSSIEYINNMCYNIGKNVNSGDPVQAHYIKNIFQLGPDSSKSTPPMFLSGDSRSGFYLKDNRDTIYRTRSGQSETDIVASGRSGVSSSPLFKGSGVPEIEVDALERHLLANVGARAPRLDRVDERILDDVKNRRFKIIDSPNQVEGYSHYRGGQALSDSDNDGIPDTYEDLLGFDKRRSDANEDKDRDGYTNIEEYLNALISGNMAQNPSPAPTEPTPSPEAPKESTPEAPASNAMLVEAESMNLTGFRSVANSTASGGNWIQTNSTGEASMNFAGESGHYEVTIGYYDESDGVTEMVVSVDSKQVSKTLWDQNLGSHLANDMTKAKLVLSSLSLSKGSLISIQTIAGANEPSRIDYISFKRVSSPVVEAAVALKEILVEAEDMELNNFVQQRISSASGNTVIQSKGLASAKMKFQGGAGTYNLTIGYFDENDGKSQMEVYVNGSRVDSFIWSQSLGSHLANSTTQTSRTIKAVKLKQGDQIELRGRADRSEPLRTDYLMITPQ